jgi:hypothetical protein
MDRRESERVSDVATRKDAIMSRERQAELVLGISRRINALLRQSRDDYFETDMEALMTELSWVADGKEPEKQWSKVEQSIADAEEKLK